jgi:hypothetical protein
MLMGSAKGRKRKNGKYEEFDEMEENEGDKEVEFMAVKGKRSKKKSWKDEGTRGKAGRMKGLLARKTPRMRKEKSKTTCCEEEAMRGERGETEEAIRLHMKNKAVITAVAAAAATAGKAKAAAEKMGLVTATF